MIGQTRKVGDSTTRLSGSVSHGHPRGTHTHIPCPSTRPGWPEGDAGVETTSQGAREGQGSERNLRLLAGEEAVLDCPLDQLSPALHPQLAHGTAGGGGQRG